MRRKHKRKNKKLYERLLMLPEFAVIKNKKQKKKKIKYKIKKNLT